MTDTNDTNDTGEVGNTSITSRVIRSRHWVLTVNNPLAENYDTLTQLFDKYVFQREKGENGTEHLQCYGFFKNPRTFKSIKKKLPNAHIEKCNNPKASIAYCQKIETRIGEPYIKGFARPLKLIGDLFCWQKKIIEIIEGEPDDRTINWVIDEEGNKGKTALAKYVCSKYNALYLTGKASDAKYLISKYFESDEERKNKLTCIFDYTRSIENYVSYQGIEEIKNGIFMNTKYECEMVMFNSPHVFVFANFEPEYEKLSKDRWNIIRL